MGDRQYLRFKEDNGKRDADVDKMSPLPVQLCSPHAQSFVSTFGDQQVAQRIQDVQVQFVYNISDMDVEQDITGTGSVTHGSQMAQIHTGTGVGHAHIYSIDSVRYRPGFSTYGLFTTVFGTPEAGVTQLAGLFDHEHGFALGYNGTEFAVSKRSNSTDDFTAGEWLDRLDGNGRSGFKLDPTKLNVFQISFGWLGAAPILLHVHGGHTKGWIPFAVIDKINQLTAPTVENPTLSVSMEVDRASGTGTDIVMKTASWGAGSVQSAQHESIGGRQFSAKSSKSVGAATLTNMLTIKSVTTFQSIESHVIAELMSASMATEGTKPISFQLYLDATLDGTPSYIDVDANNSVMQYDTAGTTVSGGTFLDSIDLAKSDGRWLDIADSGLRLRPGHTLTIAAFSANTFDANVSLRWLEKF